jgi:hypothetical protein
VNELLWNISGMKLAGKNQNTKRETCPIATLSTRNFAWVSLVLNLSLKGERLVNHLIHGTAPEVRWENYCECFVRPW